MTASEGASAGEQIIEAVRRNNVDLLEEVLSQFDNDEEKARAINEARDPIGNSALHLGVLNGSYETVDILLDQEGVEVDPVSRLEEDTPLHCVVRYARDEPEHGAFMAEVLVDAGCDPRIRNKHKQKPVELVDEDNAELENVLRGAEYAMLAGRQNDDKKEDEQGEDQGEASGSDTE